MYKLNVSMSGLQSVSDPAPAHCPDVLYAARALLPPRRRSARIATQGGYYVMDTYPNNTDLGTTSDYRTFQSARVPTQPGFAPMAQPIAMASFM